MTDTTREAVARAFQLGDRVTKVSGSKWTGHVVGFYSTALTPEGYAVESETETGMCRSYVPLRAATAPRDTEPKP